MARRLATAAIGLPVLVLILSYAHVAVFGLVVAMMAALGFHEYARMARAHRLPVLGVFGTMAAPLLAVAPLVGGDRVGGLAVVPALIALSTLLAFVVALARAPTLADALPAVATTLCGLLWLGLLGSYLLALRIDRGAFGIYALLLAVWLGDALALLTGMAVGRHRITPRVSPNKTLEGFLGALVGSVAGLWLALALWHQSLPPHWIGLLGSVLGAAAIAGDLVESGVKRGAGIKDSGQLFPGHGGILDRVDSLLFAAPVMYYGLAWLLAAPPILGQSP